MSDPKPREGTSPASLERGQKTNTEPGLGRAAHTDPGAPTELLDDALEGFAGKLPPVAVRSAESDGREAAKYQSPPRVPPAPNTLPPSAPVIVAKPADVDTGPSQLRARGIVDHKPPPPVTTDPATPKAKRSVLPVLLLSAAVLLIAAVAVIAWPKNEPKVPSLASGSLTATATPSAQFVVSSAPTGASSPSTTASATAMPTPTVHSDAVPTHAPKAVPAPKPTLSSTAASPHPAVSADDPTSPDYQEYLHSMHPRSP